MTPNYYAAGVYRMEFEVTGSNLNAIPNDAVAIPSFSNDDPQQLISTDYPDLLGVMVERSSERLVFRAHQESSHAAGYLGCIVSSDRQTVYWINETRPLP